MPQPDSGKQVMRKGSVSRASEYDGNRLKENSQIQKHIPVFNVLKIKQDILFERRIMARRDLPEASETGRDVETAKVLKIIALEIIFRMRPRADDAHIALKNVKKLWQLVNAVFAKETSKAGNARIIHNFERSAIALIHMHQAILAGVSVATMVRNL